MRLVELSLAAQLASSALLAVSFFLPLSSLDEQVFEFGRFGLDPLIYVGWFAPLVLTTLALIARPRWARILLVVIALPPIAGAVYFTLIAVAPLSGDYPTALFGAYIAGTGILATTLCALLSTAALLVTAISEARRTTSR